MRAFGFYLEKNDAKRVSKDPELARSLVKDMEGRITKALTLNIEDFAKIFFENIYDSLREFCDALLALDGYKSYSHQASITYLKEYGFSEEFIARLDMFRYKRNGSKYYGKEISPEEAESIKEFYLRNMTKIKKITKESF